VCLLVSALESEGIVVLTKKRKLRTTEGGIEGGDRALSQAVPVGTGEPGRGSCVAGSVTTARNGEKSKLTDRLGPDRERLCGKKEGTGECV